MFLYDLTPRRRNLLGGLLQGLRPRRDERAAAAVRSMPPDGDERRGRHALSGLLSLLEPVGPRKPNRPQDVRKVGRLLAASGHLASSGAPSGRYGPEMEKAVKAFQKDWKLKVDGLLNPFGPTLRTFRLQAARPLPPLGMDEAAANRRTVEALLKSGSLGLMPKLVADVHTHGGEAGRAGLNDLFDQLQVRAPAKVKPLLDAANQEVRKHGGKPLSFLDLPALARTLGNDDDDDEEEKPKPGDPDPEPPQDPGPDPDPPKDPPKDPDPDPDDPQDPEDPKPKPPKDPDDDDDDKKPKPDCNEEALAVSAARAVRADAVAHKAKLPQLISTQNDLIYKLEMAIIETKKKIALSGAANIGSRLFPITRPFGKGSGASSLNLNLELDALEKRLAEEKAYLEDLKQQQDNIDSEIAEYEEALEKAKEELESCMAGK